MVAGLPSVSAMLHATGIATDVVAPQVVGVYCE
jgi:hypothetical protein